MNEDKNNQILRINLLEKLNRIRRSNNNSNTKSITKSNSIPKNNSDNCYSCLQKYIYIYILYL